MKNNPYIRGGYYIDECAKEGGGRGDHLLRMETVNERLVYNPHMAAAQPSLPIKAKKKNAPAKSK